MNNLLMLTFCDSPVCILRFTLGTDYGGSMFTNTSVQMFHQHGSRDENAHLKSAKNVEQSRNTEKSRPFR